MNDFQRQIEIHSSLASIATNMKNVVDDVKEIKDALPDIAERLTVLETDSKVRKARESLILWAGGAVTSGLGALAMWALAHFVG